ncbi:uncharacterized protein METZ01_LOCUS80013 [marine metagenome]|uniref:Uncharacterized protein n=1 Tax=marine metagenome TaxID=408172 RepID=A0A381UG86_9ZZZZ
MNKNYVIMDRLGQVYLNYLVGGAVSGPRIYECVS